MERTEKQKERLGDLCFMVAEAYCKQGAYAFDRSQSMYDCSLYDEQNSETYQEPVINGNTATFEAAVSTDCKNTWSRVTITFPAWMVDSALQGKLKFVSFRQISTTVIEHDVMYL